MSDKTMLDLGRNRASDAYNKAKKVDANNSKEYKSLVTSVPMMIKSNGLAETVAFIFSKAKKGKDKDGKIVENVHYIFLNQIIGWLSSNSVTKSFIKKNEVITFMENVMSLSSEEYRVLTNESIAYCVWLKRFTEGLSKDDK